MTNWGTKGFIPRYVLFVIISGGHPLLTTLDGTSRLAMSARSGRQPKSEFPQPLPYQHPSSTKCMLTQCSCHMLQGTGTSSSLYGLSGMLFKQRLDTPSAHSSLRKFCAIGEPLRKLCPTTEQRSSPHLTGSNNALVFDTHQQNPKKT